MKVSYRIRKVLEAYFYFLLSIWTSQEENIKTPIQHLLVKCYTCSRQLASLGGEVLVEVFIIYFLAPLHVGLILILVEYLLNSSKKK